MEEPKLENIPSDSISVNTTNNHIIIPIVLILVFLITIIINLFIDTQQMQVSSSLQKPSGIVATSKTLPLITNTNNWKTYRNEKYGFEFRYPSESMVDEKGDGSIRVWNYEIDYTDEHSYGKEFNPGEFYLVFNTPKEESPCYDVEDYSGNTVNKLTKKFSDRVVHQFKGISIPEVRGTIFGLCAEKYNKGINIDIQETSDEYYGYIANAIFSTFKFTP